MTAVSLAEQRCLRHAAREAVARCPECGHSFCRECIAEHDDRVLCADCLTRILRKVEKRGSIMARLGTALLGVIGIACAWFFFYCLGESLARMPVSFHDGTVWETLRDADE